MPPDTVVLDSVDRAVDIDFAVDQVDQVVGFHVATLGMEIHVGYVSLGNVELFIDTHAILTLVTGNHGTRVDGVHLILAYDGCTARDRYNGGFGRRCIRRHDRPRHKKPQGSQKNAQRSGNVPGV